VELRLAKIGSSGGVGRDDLTETLELALSNDREVRALGAFRGRRVQIHRDGELFRDPGAESLRELHRVGHGRGPERNERHYVRRSHPGVLSPLDVEVDELRRYTLTMLQKAVLAALGLLLSVNLSLADEAHHAAVVVRVSFHVEDRHARNVPGRRDDSFDLLRVSPF
jgi:hypothetical protein